MLPFSGKSPFFFLEWHKYTLHRFAIFPKMLEDLCGRVSSTTYFVDMEIRDLKRYVGDRNKDAHHVKCFHACAFANKVKGTIDNLLQEMHGIKGVEGMSDLARLSKEGADILQTVLEKNAAWVVVESEREEYCELVGEWQRDMSSIAKILEELI